MGGFGAEGCAECIFRDVFRFGEDGCFVGGDRRLRTTAT